MLNKKRKNVNKEKEHENNIFNFNLEDYSNNEIRYWNKNQST